MAARDRWDQATALSLLTAGLALLAAAAASFAMVAADLGGDVHRSGDATAWALTISLPEAVLGSLAIGGAWALWHRRAAGRWLALFWVLLATVGALVSAAADGNILSEVRLTLVGSSWARPSTLRDIVERLGDVTFSPPAVLAVGAILTGALLLGGWFAGRRASMAP